MSTAKDWNEAHNEGMSAKEAADKAKPREKAFNGAHSEKKQQEASLLKFVRQMKLSTKVDAIVKGVLPRGVTAALYGPTGAGKTFVGIDLGLHAALGRDWFGRRVPKAVPVLYVVLEGAAGFESRVLGQNGLSDIGDMFAQLAVPVLLNKSKAGEAGLATVIAAAKELATAAGQAVGLVVVDTVARAMTGDDENSTQDMSMFVGRMQAIASATGAAVLGIHHPGKDDSRGMRGAYALMAGCDVVLKIEMRGEARMAIAEKMREAPTGDLFAFKLDRVVLGKDDDGDEMTTCRVVPAVVVHEASEAKLSKNQATMLAILKSAAGPLKLEEWNARAKEAGLGINRNADLFDYRESLRRKGLVYQGVNGWSAKK